MRDDLAWYEEEYLNEEQPFTATITTGYGVFNSEVWGIDEQDALDNAWSKCPDALKIELTEVIPYD